MRLASRISSLALGGGLRDSKHLLHDIRLRLSAGEEPVLVQVRLIKLVLDPYLRVRGL